ncbi:UNVERIFIED_CONTAM: hypothetical protein PYX00_000596 [Menopon gallinae]|uniref:Myb/SANT-like DNA-binding domain-containing protein n=1 Tax=Menopon gallinae TaxID=328185 RepID=A0AAW2IBS1_9NEOP
MDRNDESRRYKWTPSASNLLVSIWSHDMVQNRLRLSSRNQAIWESIARYMGKKGFNVTGLQCRTRIKNMLCSYYEAVRKRGNKKSSNQNKTFEEIEEEEEDGGVSDVTVDGEAQSEIKAASDSSYDIEYLDVNNQEVQVSNPVSEIEILSNIEKIITKAIDSQTKVILQAMKIQSDLIEKLLVSETEKLEILIAEKESRRRLEDRLDRLLTRLETPAAPHLAYMGPLIETQQSEVL